MISVKAPGKLYIAGEYAVVETGQPAILVALNQFVYVNLEKSNDLGSIISKQYKENSLYWKREGNQIIFDNRDNPFHYILSAINLVEEYAQSLGKKMEFYHLKIDSELDSPDGKKYGLGSSAAVTVATIKALSEFYELNLSKEHLFKLASIAHLNVQGNGSLGDIAASVYGGWIAYHSFDKEWLKVAQRSYTISELLDLNWPNLKVTQLTPPDNLNLLIGWTGSPASTSHLVDAVALHKANNQNKYNHFLENSWKCIDTMITGFKENSLSKIQKSLIYNRELLRNLASLSSVEIETPLLTKLITSAEKFGGAAKTSGAGGGDCGIVLIDKSMNVEPLFAYWKENGIVPLSLHVYQD